MQNHTPPQLYLCENKLHVSAIYSHHQAEHRTISRKKMKYEYNAIKRRMDEISSYINIQLYIIV